jgi:hypothetical protein
VKVEGRDSGNAGGGSHGVQLVDVHLGKCDLTSIFSAQTLYDRTNSGAWRAPDKYGPQSWSYELIGVASDFTHQTAVK